MLSLKNINSFSEEEKELLSSLNNQCQIIINDHLEMCKEEGFEPNFDLIMTDLCKQPIREFQELVNEKLEELEDSYGLDDELTIDIENEFQELKADTIETHIRVMIYIQNKKDYLILAMSGLFPKLYDIFNEYFNYKVYVFVNGINSRILV